MTLINRVLEGQFITGSDVGILNSLSIFRVTEVLGIIPVPVLNLNFLQGIMHLVKWDYSFFGGNAALIQFFLYSLTAALAFLLFTIMIPLAYQIFQRLR